MIKPLFAKFILTKSRNFVLIGSLLFLAISVQPVAAQTEGDTGVKDAVLRIGAKVGMTNSAFAVDHENVTDSKKGLLVGGFASYRLLEFLAVQGELLYQQQGAANVNPSQTTLPDGSALITFNNIIQHNVVVPVFAQLTVPGFPADNPMIPYLGAGFDYTYNVKTYQVNKSRTLYDNGTSYTTNSFTDVSNKYKQNDMGLLFGVGFLFKTSNWMYTLDARYRFGMTNLNNVRPDNPGNDFTGNVFSISAGVAIF